MINGLNEWKRGSCLIVSSKPYLIWYEVSSGDSSLYLCIDIFIQENFFSLFYGAIQPIKFQNDSAKE